MVPLEVPTIPETMVPPTFPSALLNVPLPLDNSSTDPAGWEGAVPADWVPIIARDSREAAPRCLAHSDAYLSGQPPKRRRLNNDKKPHGDTQTLIADTLQVIS